MKRLLTLSLVVIALITTGSSTVARVPPQTANSLEERILGDAALFDQAARAVFYRMVLQSDSIKSYHAIPEYIRPAIAAIQSRYGEPDAVVTERIPETIRSVYTNEAGITSELPESISSRDLPVFYYGRVGFVVEEEEDIQRVLYVTARASAARDHAQGMPPTGSIALQEASAASWRQLAGGTADELRSVHFLNENQGWAAGANATLLRTTNGGNTWSPVNTGAEPNKTFSSVRFLDQNAGFVFGASILGRTLDGGASWTVIPLPTTVDTAINVSHNGFFPLSSELVWTCGDGDRNPPLPPNSSSTIARYNVTPAGAISSSLTAVSTSFPPSPLTFLAVQALDASNVWVVGGSGVIGFLSPSDPIRFSFQNSGVDRQLNAIQMLSSSSGWVVGNKGTILKYTGNAVWVAQSSGTTANLRDVHFIDSNRGWAVGDRGTIVSTVNGGSTWTVDASEVTADLRGVYAVSENAAFAVGAGGVILKLEGPPVGDFALGFDSASLNGDRGAKVKVVVNINRTGGFTGGVTVTPPDLSAEGIVTKPPDPITTSDQTVAWKFKIKGSAATGPHQLTFTGRDASGRDRSATVTLVIQ